MCWPLSVAASESSSERARPPGMPAVSKTVTSWPACVARTAAARPAQPAPTTATLTERSAAAPLRLARDPQLAQRRQRDALVQHLEAAGLDLAQQAAIDVAHHQRGPLRVAILGRQQRERLVVEAMRALGLELHQRREAVAVAPGRVALEDLGGLDVELLQLGDRQVDAATARVVADVADDVGELHRETQAMRERHRLRLRAAHDVARDLADDAGHQVAILLQAGEVEEACLLEVGLATLDHR